MTPGERTLNEYFRLLSENDIDAWLRLWSDDGIDMHVPFAAGGLPKRVTDKEHLGRLYRDIGAGFVKLEFPSVELFPSVTGERVFARWTPSGELTGGGSYTNQSVGVFDFDAEGRITRFWEYFSPLGFDESFTLS